MDVKAVLRIAYSNQKERWSERVDLVKRELQWFTIYYDPPNAQMCGVTFHSMSAGSCSGAQKLSPVYQFNVYDRKSFQIL